MRHPDFVELETFLVAARTGSLTQASEELLISKTAVAKRISALEALVDCRLFERGSRGVRLTDAGRQFVPQVEQVLAEAERALATIDRRRGARDVLRIAGARSLTGAQAVSTERVLAETEHLFAEVFHEVGDGIAIASLEDRRILEANDAYCRIVGYAREEIVGRTSAEPGVLSALDLADMHARVTSEDGTAEGEIAITSKSGEQRTAAVMARLVTLGGVRRVLVNVRDVTERVERERMLRVRAAQQKALAELGLRALRRATAAELIDHAARAVRSALGVEIVAVDQLLADGDLRVYSTAEPGDRPIVLTDSAGSRSQAGYTLKSAQPVISADLRAERRFTPAAELMAHGARSSASVVIGVLERPWGVLIAASARTRVFTADDVVFLEGVAHVLGIVWQREAAEHELSRLAQAAELSADAIVSVDLEGRVRHWSPGAERLLGVSAKDVIGRRVDEDDAIAIEPGASTERPLLCRVCAQRALPHDAVGDIPCIDQRPLRASQRHRPSGHRKRSLITGLCSDRDLVLRETFTPDDACTHILQVSPCEDAELDRGVANELLARVADDPAVRVVDLEDPPILDARDHDPIGHLVEDLREQALGVSQNSLARRSARAGQRPRASDPQRIISDPPRIDRLKRAVRLSKQLLDTRNELPSRVGQSHAARTASQQTTAEQRLQR